MNLTPIAAVLLAAGSREQLIQDLRRGFQNPSPAIDTTTLLALLVALCLVVWLLARLAGSRPQQREEAAQTDDLSRSLSLLGLDRGECNDIQTIARHAALPQPTAMLLSPANLAHAARQALRVHADPQLWPRIDKLSVKLYGTGLPDAAPADRGTA